MKQFELSLPKAVYFGEYCFIDGKLFIDEVHYFSEDAERIEIDSLNDAEIFKRIYSLVEKDKCDEIEEEREQILAERKSRLTDF
jgi:hypothetical protein